MGINARTSRRFTQLGGTRHPSRQPRGGAWRRLTHLVARHHCAWGRYSAKLGLENELDAHRKQRSVLPQGSRGEGNRENTPTPYRPTAIATSPELARITSTDDTHTSIGCAVFDPYPWLHMVEHT